MNRRPIATVAACAVLAALGGPPSRGARRDAWVEVRSPNFIIVSNAGEKQARRTAIQFEQIHSLFRDSLAVAQGHPSPVITIFALKDEKSLSELLPEYWTKGHMHPSGVFAYRINQYYAAVNLEAQGTNPFATMYHEYYHSLTMPYFPDLPVWLSEGLADFFGQSEINGNTATMGLPDRDLIELLKTNKLIPLDVLFHVDTTSPYYNEENKTSVFYAESWALTHYLMIGDKQTHRQLLLDYATALSSGATPDQAAAKAFGDLKRLQDELSRYVGKFTFSYFQIKAPTELASTELQVRTISDAEEEAYRGGFFAIRRRPEAKQILQNAVNMDPKLALAQQNLGLEEYLEGNRDSALASISEAVQLDPRNGLTHYFRAYLSFSGAGGFPQDPQIEDDLQKSIAAKPDFAPANALYGLYLSSRRQRSDEALRFAKRAVELEPGNTEYTYYLAQVLARMQRFDEAQFVATRARANARNPHDRATLDQFFVYLQSARSLSNGTSADEDAIVKTPRNSDGGTGRDTSAKQEDSAEPDNSREVTGIVVQESCAGGLKLQIRTLTETFTLHVPASAHASIRIMAKPAPGFDICTSLRGSRVNARYVPDPGKASVGSVQQLTILAPDSPSDADTSSDTAADTPLRAGSKTSRAPNFNATLSGRVTAVTCSGNEMRITLLVRDTEFELHARDFSKVHYEQETPFVSGHFQPCTQLQDHEAIVEYVVTEKETYDGEIQSVEVGK
jgi:tetratricopeptide (TPR) repeat protein